MLASPAKGELNEDWSADHKLDGLRALIRYEHGVVTITNRNEVDITRQFPDVEQELGQGFKAAGLDSSWMLDGELLTADGLFTSIATRGKQVKPLDIVSSMHRLPATFVPFDLVELAGRDVMAEAFAVRRVLLVETVSTLRGYGTKIDVVVSSPKAGVLIAATKRLGLEGVIVKNPASRYVPGARSRDWIKVKNTQSVTCIATGYEAGQGARAHFGAMHLAMLDGTEIVSVGRVGTGFTESVIRDLKATLDAGQPIVVEIECLNRTASNQLRFPVYKGIRTDQSVMDATVDQLELLPVC